MTEIYVDVCTICMEEDDMYFTECNHMYCINCLRKISNCALCRKKLLRNTLCVEIKNFTRERIINRVPGYTINQHHNNNNLTEYPPLVVHYLWLDPNERALALSGTVEGDRFVQGLLNNPLLTT